MSILKKLLLIFSILGMVLFADSCTNIQKAKRQEIHRRKQFEKEKKDRDREAQSAYEASIRKHYNMQTASTKKMMKSTARQSQRYKDHKREFFLKRWFTPKHRRGNTKGNQK